MNNLGFGPGNILANHRANQMRLMQMGRAPSPIGATAPRQGPNMGTQLGQGLGAIGKMLGQFGAQREADEKTATAQKAVVGLLNGDRDQALATQGGPSLDAAAAHEQSQANPSVPPRLAKVMRALSEGGDPMKALQVYQQWAVKDRPENKPTMMTLFHPDNPDKSVNVPADSPLAQRYFNARWTLEPTAKIAPKPGPQTDLGKLAVDVDAGRISEEDAAAARAAILAGDQDNDGAFGNSFLGHALDKYTRLGQIPANERTPEQNAQFATAAWALQRPITGVDSLGRQVTHVPKNLPDIAAVPSPGGRAPSPGSGPGGISLARSATANDDPPEGAPPPHVGPVPAGVQKRVDDLKVVIRNGNGAVQDLKRAMELSEKAYSGLTAGITRAGARFLGVDDDRVEASTEMEQLVLQTVLPNLKQIFGGNPTEGERAMLLDMNASLTMNPGERKKLLRNALTMLQRRMEAAQADLESTLGGNPLNSAENDSKTISATPDEIREVTDINVLLGMDPDKMSDEQAGAYLDQMKKLMGIK